MSAAQHTTRDGARGDDREQTAAGETGSPYPVYVFTGTLFVELHGESAARPG